MIEGKDWEPVAITDEICRDEYFERSLSIPENRSPFNLGVYQTKNNDDKEILKAVEYAGIVPLLKLKNDGKIQNESEEKTIIKISSRFGISPTKMLEKVLSGNDYYENPDMLKVKSYSESEWKELKKTKEFKKEKILFGIVNGIGDIELFSEGDGKEQGKKADVGIVNTVGTFEIIDFVNKAKKVCKKNLKKQSQKIEENLNCKVKGRILIQKQIRYNLSKGQEQKVYCSYNKMSEDIQENQIIKYALYLCKKESIGDSLAEDIRFCMNTLGNVPLKKCSMADFIGLKNNGAFKQYKDVLNAAKKIIKRYSVSYSNASSNKKTDNNSDPKTEIQVVNGTVLPYFIDMNLLFEYYCRAIFREEIDKFNEDTNRKTKFRKIKFKLESAEKAPRDLFQFVEKASGGPLDLKDYTTEEKREELKKHFMKKYIPDIVITYDENKVAAVFDAKYSEDKSPEKCRSRTHQILFYMKMLGCEYGGIASPLGEDNKPVYGSIGINYRQDHEKTRETKEDIPNLFYVPISAGGTGGYMQEILGKIENGIGKQEEEQKRRDTIIRLIKKLPTEGKKEDIVKKINELKKIAEGEIKDAE